MSKNRFVKIVISMAILVSLLVPYCQPIFAAADVGNTTGTAVSINADTDITGEINYPGDVDFFKFQTQRNGTYIIESTESVDVYGEAYNKDLVFIASNDDISLGDTNFRFNAYMQEKYTYYIKVHHYNRSQVGAYKIRINSPDGEISIDPLLYYSSLPLYVGSTSILNITLNDTNTDKQRSYFIKVACGHDKTTFWDMASTTASIGIGISRKNVPVSIKFSQDGPLFTRVQVFDREGGTLLTSMVKEQSDNVLPAKLPVDGSIQSYNDRSTLVSDIQYRLKLLGLSIQDDGGYFGKDTLAAIIALQIQQNLTVDGRVGNQTRTKINDLINGGKTADAVFKKGISDIQNKIISCQSSTLSEGSSGYGVIYLQAILNSYFDLTIDSSGEYGINTKAAILAIRQKTGMFESDKTDSDTWTKIYYLLAHLDDSLIKDLKDKQYYNLHPLGVINITVSENQTYGQTVTVEVKCTNAKVIKVEIDKQTENTYGYTEVKTVQVDSYSLSTDFKADSVTKYRITATVNPGAWNQMIATKFVTIQGTGNPQPPEGTGNPTPEESFLDKVAEWFTYDPSAIAGSYGYLNRVGIDSDEGRKFFLDNVDEWLYGGYSDEKMEEARVSLFRQGILKSDPFYNDLLQAQMDYWAEYDKPTWSKAIATVAGIATAEVIRYAVVNLIAKRLASRLPRIPTGNGYSTIETNIINETKAIINSSEFSQIRAAQASGEFIEVNINGRTILYEPEVPGSGFSLFEENAFIIGNAAFTSEEELRKTILHELYRLYTSKAASGVNGPLASQETEAAFNFAEKAIKEVYP